MKKQYEVTYKLSLNSGNSVFTGHIVNTSIKHNKLKNLMWVKPIRKNGKFFKGDTVCINTRNLVAKRR